MYCACRLTTLKREWLILRGFSELSRPVAPPHLLGFLLTVFFRLWEDTFLIGIVSLGCQQKAYYDYFVTLQHCSASLMKTISAATGKASSMNTCEKRAFFFKWIVKFLDWSHPSLPLNKIIVCFSCQYF